MKKPLVQINKKIDKLEKRLKKLKAKLLLQEEIAYINDNRRLDDFDRLFWNYR